MGLGGGDLSGRVIGRAEHYVVWLYSSLPGILGGNEAERLRESGAHLTGATSEDNAGSGGLRRSLSEIVVPFRLPDSSVQRAAGVTAGVQTQ
jgi:hypothetical protein